MPRYEWKCMSCGNIDELQSKVGDDIKCSICNMPTEMLFPTKTGVIYKTIGFYKTDIQNVERQRNGRRFSKPIKIKKG